MTISVVSGAFESSHEGLQVELDAFRRESWHGKIAVLAVAVPIFAFMAFVIARTDR